MTYQTTITQKGQITIPKQIRDALELSRSTKVTITLGTNKKSATIRPADDFLNIAKGLRVGKKGIDPIKEREALEKTYERK